MKVPALAAALLALAVAAPASYASSHREAPLTSTDPTADDTDFYVFKAPDAPDKVTFVANWIPFEDPAGGPNFYKFDDRAHYYLNVDNTGDGIYDVRYLFTFKTNQRNAGTFLYGLGGPITSPRDKDLNVLQSYTVTKETYRDGKVVSAKVLGTDLLAAPDNVGAKTTPDYPATAAKAVEELPGGAKVFAGQRDDPFYASLGRIFDTVNLTGAGLGNMGGGVDDLAGYAVHSTVLQVPEGLITRNHKPVSGPGAKNAVVGVWSTTERRSLKVRGGGSRFRQISRLGNPLVNEVVIPLGQKDRFNRTTPDRDAKLYGKYVVKPELAKVLNALFSVGAPENNRTDIVQAVLQGVPGLNAFPGKAGTNPTDTLKINLGTPPSASPQRLGVLAGDNAGYPNGRRLTDDVVDIDLQVVAGALKGNMVPLGDGVDQNNVPFLSSFPYVAPPRPGANPAAGFGSQLKTAGGAQGPDTLLVSAKGGSGAPVAAGVATGRDGGGAGVGLWLLIAAGSAALLALGVIARRSRGTEGREPHRNPEGAAPRPPPRPPSRDGGRRRMAITR